MSTTGTVGPATRAAVPVDLLDTVRVHVEALQHLCGDRPLARIALDGLGPWLGRAATGHLSQLREVTDTLGITRLPCCDHHDRERVRTWAAAVEHLVATGDVAP